MPTADRPSKLPVVAIRARDARRIAAGHPWVFDSAVESLPKGLVDGDLVRVDGPGGRLLGVGPYNGQSRIRVRLLARDEVGALDSAFFEAKIRAALAVRRRHLREASSYRVVNSESDGLSGLVVDRYEDVLVLQIASLGLDQRKRAVAEALERIFAPAAILERSDGAARKFEGLAPAAGVLAGRLEQARGAGPSAGADPHRFPIRLNDLVFEVDLEAGHKTGLYLDQQANYEAVGRFARGARVLDCFSFLGGFGLHAARAGAASVVMLDQSEDAVAASLRNAERNGLGDRCRAEVANVFDWLKARSRAEQRASEPPFDLIVLDPPSFTRSRASVPDALRGYKEIHLRALRLLAEGGVLATFCCSHHVDARAFEGAILSAAIDAKVVLRRIASYSQALDHPVVPAIPETEYLKGFAYEKVDAGRGSVGSKGEGA